MDEERPFSTCFCPSEAFLNPNIICYFNFNLKKSIVGISRVVTSSLNPPEKKQKMVVVIYGGRGWIGQQCCKKLVERKIKFTLANCRIGWNSDDEVRDLRIFCYHGIKFRVCYSQSILGFG